MYFDGSFIAGSCDVNNRGFGHGIPISDRTLRRSHDGADGPEASTESPPLTTETRAVSHNERFGRKGYRGTKGIDRGGSGSSRETWPTEDEGFWRLSPP